MHILLLTQYFTPETVGAGIWVHELAQDLFALGNRVTVLTTFPNYPTGEVFEGYRRQTHSREQIDGSEVIRAWIYSSDSKQFSRRVAKFASFTVSSLLTGVFVRERPDVIYAVLPPLPLGLTAIAIGAVKHCPVIVNIQDIFPRAAVVTGILKNKRLIRLFEKVELQVYQRADHIVVISEGFREDLLEKGVPPAKISVVPNWADPGFIRPGPKQNPFRNELNVNGKFVVLYSGGLGHNSELETLLDAAALLRDEPLLFVIVGDGVRKSHLETMVRNKQLHNVVFRPFQPLETYPQVLAAGDVTVVTLSNRAGSVSVPSKIFKQMAAGRPILAITPGRSELDRLIQAAGCGMSIPPDDVHGVAAALRWAVTHPGELDAMGVKARSFLEEHHSRSLCTTQIQRVLEHTVRQ